MSSEDSGKPVQAHQSLPYSHEQNKEVDEGSFIRLLALLESFCLFCCFTSQVNSYGHGGTVSSPNHTFSWASLKKQLSST